MGQSPQNKRGRWRHRNKQCPGILTILTCWPAERSVKFKSCNWMAEVSGCTVHKLVWRDRLATHEYSVTFKQT